MREITKIIIHCTATPSDLDVGVPEITIWHLKRNFRDIGYHYVVKLDGSIEEGREESEVGAHCKGYNTSSIGVCYVGGVETGHGIPDKNCDTRTPEQKKSLLKLLKALKKKYPKATIHGHNEFSNKDCPCFDAQKEYKLI